MHLTDEQLNEYLDNESTERVQIEEHLSSCEKCAGRLTALQLLFTEIESLPDLAFSRDISTPFISTGLNVSTRGRNLSTPLPRFLRLTVTLQAVTAAIVLIIAAPLIMRLVSRYLFSTQSPSFAEIFLQLQSQWMIWLETLSQFQMPAIPEIPIIELSSLAIMLTLAGASTLWLVGNGLLLRNQK